MSSQRWKSRAKRSREAAVKEQEQLFQSLLGERSLPESELRLYRDIDASGASQHPAAYPFRFGGDPFPYYRFTPHYFGGQQSGRLPNAPPGPPPQRGSLTPNAPSKKSASRKGKGEARQDAGYPPSAYGYYPYAGQGGGYPGYYPYPYPYGYQSGQPYPSVQCPGRGQYPALPAPPSDPEQEEEARTIKSGMMSVDGRRPLFLVALFVVSIAVLLVSFPLTLLSAGYIGPLGLVFATGPFATVFAFWAIYLTPCECYPNVEWATSRIRVFATAAAVFDGVGAIGVPISMYGAQCPDDDDTMLGCEDELPAAKGISMAVAVVLGTHGFLCLLVRSNARKLAESKFGDERTEGITLTPARFDRM